MFTDYIDTLIEQRTNMEEENYNGGIFFPFLVKKGSSQIIAARVIPTRRKDKENICFACVKPNMQPNGIFLGFDEEELGCIYNLEIVYMRISVSSINIWHGENGESRICFAPSHSDFNAFFQKVNALFINDLRVLENMR